MSLIGAVIGKATTVYEFSIAQQTALFLCFSDRHCVAVCLISTSLNYMNSFLSYQNWVPRAKESTKRQGIFSSSPSWCKFLYIVEVFPN